jgi:hypothetical protein
MLSQLRPSSEEIAVSEESNLGIGRGRCTPSPIGCGSLGLQSIPLGCSVNAATPLPVQAGVALRRRFQKGTVIIRGKTPTRCGVYRQDVLQSDGTFKRVQRCVVLGPVSGLSERAAWKRFQPYLDAVNAASKLPPRSGITLKEFVEEWRTSVAVNLKSGTTRAAESHLRAHILPIESRII